MEKIGYFDAAGSNIMAGLNKLEDLSVDLKFGDRDIVENMDGVIQPVCAGCIITSDNKVLIINKAAKSTGKISPEKDKSLLYIGGHLDESDCKNSNLETFKNGMKREIFEELRVGVEAESDFDPLIVYTPITEKSAKHVGIIFPVFIEKEFTPEFTDGTARFIKIEDLSQIENFESWSRIISKELLLLIASKKVKPWNNRFIDYNAQK